MSTRDDFFSSQYPRQAPPNPTDFAQFCAERRARQHIVANLFVPEPREIEPVQDLRTSGRGIATAVAAGLTIYGVLYVVWLVVQARWLR